MAQAVADGVRMLNGTSKAIRTNESYRATSYSRVRRPATSSSSEPGDSLPRRTQIQGSAFCIRGVRAAEGFSESPTRSLYRLIVEIARQITGEPPSVKSTTRPQRCRAAWQVDRVLSSRAGLNRSCSRSLRYGAIALLPSPRPTRSATSFCFNPAALQAATTFLYPPVSQKLRPSLYRRWPLNSAHRICERA